MSKTGDDAEVIRLDRVRDKAQLIREDAEAAALAKRFHEAMGWKGYTDTPSAGKRKNGKKKRK